MKFVNLFGLLFAFSLVACFGKKEQAPEAAPVVAEAPAEADGGEAPQA